MVKPSSPNGPASRSVAFRLARRILALLRPARPPLDAEEVWLALLRGGSVVLAYPQRGRVAHLVQLRHRAQHGWRGAAECRPHATHIWFPVAPWLARRATLCPACLAHAARCAACRDALRPYGSG